MSNEELDFEVKQTSHNLSEELKRKLGRVFSDKTRRERFTGTRRIVIDPVSFLIGGIGAVAIGGVTDESNDGGRENSNGALFANSALRTVVYPIRTAIRFFTGGCIYVAVDSLALNIVGRPSPLISGAVTGLCFANGARTVVLLGSTLGMALFAQVADNVLDGIFNRSLFE